MFDTSWDVETYREKSEYDGQWLLRKSFMEKHKDKYPEDRLVCLARIFANIEFLGCVYNPELMILVRNLSRQVDEIVKYQQDRKNRLSRTFVKASDAVKKNTAPERINPYKRKFEPEVQIQRPINDEKEWQFYQKVRAQSGYKGKFVMCWNKTRQDKTMLKNSLSQSATKCQLDYKYVTIKNDDNTKTYQLVIDGEILAEVKSTNSLGSSIKTELAETALEEIKKYCFSITPTNDYQTVEKSDTPQTLDETADETSAELSQGIGAKIMKMMGWKGEGLGKNEHGIKNPIEASIKVNRRGIGSQPTRNNNQSTSNKQSIQEFKSHMRSYLEDYCKSDERKSLQFSSDFTKEERAIVHQICQKMQTLKSQSYGKGANRTLRVSKKTFSVWTLVEELLDNGGQIASHILEKPTAV